MRRRRRRHEDEFDPIEFWGARDAAPFIGCFQVLIAIVLWGLPWLVIWGLIDFFFVPHLPTQPKSEQFYFPPLPEEKGK